MPSSSALGIDIGGTSTRAALVYDGVIHRSSRASTPANGDPVALSKLLRHIATETLIGTNAQTPIGVALPGIRDPVGGVMKRCFNLPLLEGLDIPAFFKQALGASACIETDVNAAAFAQWRKAARNVQRFLYLSIGTGIGGGLIVEGKILRPTGPAPAHFGLIVVDQSPDAPAGRTGAPGCLEAVAAGPAWEAADRAAATRAAESVARALEQLAASHTPDVIALGGGVIDHRNGWYEQIAAAYAARPPLPGVQRPDLMRGPLPSDDAGVIGAALLACRAD